jgi:uncharacterized membrane protein
LVITAAPRVIMAVATRRVEDRAGGANAWLHSDRVTPQTQEVVRSSPDLAYSACAWDLSEGPVRISAPGWDDYFSLSLYDDRTDNFFAANDRTTGGDRIEVLLTTRDQAADPPRRGGVRIVTAPSETGIALLRYLAPTASAFARTDELRRSAVCVTRSPRSAVRGSSLATLGP